MAAGTTRKISAASARAHTRKPKSKTSSKLSGVLKNILLVCFTGFLAWAYQATRPPTPKTCGSTDGPPITAPRIQLKDGRHLAYIEYGVPKDIAKHKIVFAHPIDGCRHELSAITARLSPELVESEGIYIASFDRPGYGESDPHPTRTPKSLAFDIEEFADKLGLGSKFYILGFSAGGQVVWTCLKYIPHRLKGAGLISPAINYWWSGIPTNLSREAFGQQLLRDQWALRVAHYMPWLTYWWNTQKLFPIFSIFSSSPIIFSRQDMELIPRILPVAKSCEVHGRQQGEFESIHRDAIVIFGNWEFDPTDLENPSSVPVHLWQGDEDRLVPVKLQRHIVNKLPWVQYHEVSGAGHMLHYADGMADSIIQALLFANKDLS